MREPRYYGPLRDTERQVAAEKEFREVGTTAADRSAAATDHAPAAEVTEPEPTRPTPGTQPPLTPEAQAAPAPEPTDYLEAALAHEARMLEAMQTMRADPRYSGIYASDIRDYVRRETEKFERQQAKDNPVEMTDAQQAKLDRLMGGMTRETGHEQELDGGRDTRER